MKKKIVFLLILVFFLGWIWRYQVVNTYYNQMFPDNPVIVYSTGEIVPIEDDLLNYGSTANGYAIQANNLEVITLSEAIGRWPDSQQMDLGAAEKLVVVHITLFNESCSDGIMLTDFKLHSRDIIAFMNWNLLTAANPILEGNYGVVLPQGAKLDLVLPFSLNSTYFNVASWKNLENSIFYLQVTSYPTIKEITLNR